MMRAWIDYITKSGAGYRRSQRPIAIPAAIYDRAIAEGVIDMTPYIRQEPVPAAPQR